MEKNETPQSKYDRENCIGFYLKLNKKTEADIIAWLELQDNKNGAVKQLIRNEMNKAK